MMAIPFDARPTPLESTELNGAAGRREALDPAAPPRAEYRKPTLKRLGKLRSVTGSDFPITD
jgi:hypothetical protein